MPGTYKTDTAATSRAGRVIIEDVARIASLTVDRQFKSYPQHRSLFFGERYELCLRDTRYHLEALAQALLADSTDLYVAYSVWAQEVLIGVGLPDACLVGCLLSMRDVLESRLSDDGAAHAVKYVDAALNAVAEWRPQQTTHLGSDNPYSDVGRAYMDHLLTGDRASAMEVVVRVADDGVPLAEIYEHVFRAVQHEVGLGWQQGRLSVAMEHYVTGATQIIMAHLAQRPPFTSRGRVRFVGACVEGEQHGLGLRMTCDLLEAEGWAVNYLGPDTPDFAVLQAVEQFRPEVLGLSASLPFRVDGVRRVIAAVRAQHGDSIGIVVGGRPFAQVDGLWQSVGADAFCPEAKTAPARISELIDQRECA